MQHDTNVPGGSRDQSLQKHGAALDGLLGAQLGRIRRRFAMHGIGWILAAVGASAILYYLLDRSLHLPAGVRVVLSLSVLALTIVEARRRLYYPMARAFGSTDVAIAIERHFPALRQKLISAVQLKSALQSAGTSQDPGTSQDHRLRNQSAVMIERLVEEAARECGRIPVHELLNPNRTLRVWAAGGTLAAVALSGALWNPTTARVFLARALGLSAVYPRETSLCIELPRDSEDYRIAQDEDMTTVTMAAGGDLPVMVLAKGRVPREVFLDIEGGRGMPPEVAMTQRSVDRFRHMFRNVHTDFDFHARGGDDDRGDLVVRVVTVRPPLCGTITAKLQFPAYTGLAAEERSGGSIEALEGTKVELVVTATAAVEDAELHFLESDKRVPLVPATLQDDSGAGSSFRGSFVIDRTDRYQVDLVSPNGLRNPNPGDYTVVALKDHAPVGRVLLPSGDDINVVVPGAIVPVRVEAKDDYGLLAVDVETRTGRSDVERRFQLLPAVAGAVPAASAPPAATAEPPIKNDVLTELLDLTEIGGAPGGPTVGDTVSIVTRLRDNHEPEGSVTELSRRQVHVVDHADLQRRIGGHFRRLREEVEKVSDLQRDRRENLAAILEDLPADIRATSLTKQLVHVDVGQGSILSAAQRIHEEFMRAYNVHLFNRLEESNKESAYAPKVVELYLRYHREHDEPEPFLGGFYRMVATEQREGRLGAMEKTLDPILGMLTRSDRIAAELAPRSVRAVQAALVTDDRNEMFGLLRDAERLQGEIQTELAALLARLEQWNELQDVIQHARGVRDLQKDVETRTRSLLGERK